uniref:Uncharacterized protein n=1 Tax=Trypanosoma vivax (strain Y486) TaxID=1055687 RepID=G0U0A0_TRYVY|nr:hypothetical protein TVY486_0801060 [Trypanosoma vivax Y486]
MKTVAPLHGTCMTQIANEPTSRAEDQHSTHARPPLPPPPSTCSRAARVHRAVMPTTLNNSSESNRDERIIFASSLTPGRATSTKHVHVVVFHIPSKPRGVLMMPQTITDVMNPNHAMWPNCVLKITALKTHLSPRDEQKEGNLLSSGPPALT